MSDIHADPPPIDMREELARIDQIHADIQLKLAQTSLAQRETERRSREVRFGPGQFAATVIGASVGATAALFGAALALLRWIGG